MKEKRKSGTRAERPCLTLYSSGFPKRNGSNAQNDCTCYENRLCLRTDVSLSAIFGFFAALSLALTLWQWAVARRFPLHQRVKAPFLFTPAVTLLKPLKGSDASTEICLRSWLEQDYPGQV